jgi:hypothetical protein
MMQEQDQYKSCSLPKYSDRSSTFLSQAQIRNQVSFFFTYAIRATHGKFTTREKAEAAPLLEYEKP